MQRALIADGYANLIGLAVLALGLAGCGSTVGTTGSGVAVTSSASTTTTTTSTGASTPAPDTISVSGTPATTVSAGQAYAFQPAALDSDGNALTYSVTNLPAWASFDATTGTLTGTPDESQVGTYANISVSASDGIASTALAPFTVTVTADNSTSGTATLSWAAPTENTNGSALADLAGYRIYYGTSADALTQVIDVANVTTYVVTGLTAGTYYFAVAAYSSTGAQGGMSDTASKTI
jgi:hypothetical protein